jgi:hypothetical protein
MKDHDPGEAETDSVEIYDLLVIRRRWGAARYSRFIADTMKSALL